MKKLFSITLVMVLIFSLFAPVVHASENDLEKIISDVDKTNNKIDKMVNKAIEDVEKEITRYINDLETTDELNEKIDKIILDLVNDTNKIAADMIEKAAKKGYVVVCELVEVEIGGRNVWIDPLRVGSY